MDQHLQNKHKKWLWCKDQPKYAFENTCILINPGLLRSHVLPIASWRWYPVLKTYPNSHLMCSCVQIDPSDHYQGANILMLLRWACLRPVCWPAVCGKCGLQGGCQCNAPQPQINSQKALITLPQKTVRLQRLPYSHWWGHFPCQNQFAVKAFAARIILLFDNISVTAK